MPIPIVRSAPVRLAAMARLALLGFVGGATLVKAPVKIWSRLVANAVIQVVGPLPHLAGTLPRSLLVVLVVAAIVFPYVLIAPILIELLLGPLNAVNPHGAHARFLRVRPIRSNGVLLVRVVVMLTVTLSSNAVVVVSFVKSPSTPTRTLPLPTAGHRAS